MPSTHITRRSALGLGLAACASALPAWSQTAANASDFPKRPIHLIVPFSAAGTSDVLARALGASLGPLLKQSIVVENRPGANGNLGSQEVAKAAPDGYTLLLAVDGTMAINPALYPNLPYKPEQDFVPLSRIAIVPLLIVASSALKANTLQEMIALSKSSTNALDFSSAGVGSAGHLAGELLKLQTGARLEHVPYKGGGQAITDVISGQVPLMVTAYATAGPFIQSGKLKVLAVTSAQRLPNLPNAPTVAESGVAPDFEAASWYGVMAPAKTPPAIVEQLHHALMQALKTPELSKRMTDIGAIPTSESSAQFAQVLREDIKRWSGIVKKAQLTIN